MRNRIRISAETLRLRNRGAEKPADLRLRLKFILYAVCPLSPNYGTYIGKFLRYTGTGTGTSHDRDKFLVLYIKFSKKSYFLMMLIT
jgi:hypothetical protein